VIKHKDPVTPQNQNRSINRLVIGGGGNGVGNVSMSREASSTISRRSGAQSPTLPAMVCSLCVVFLKIYFRVYCLLLLLIGTAIDI
jgi:hypothetical protein